jgi:hypothetical protein
MSTSEPHAGVVACSACEWTVTVTEPNEAIEIYRRHKRITGHEIDWERTALNVTASSADIESVLIDLEGTYPEGVPTGVLTAALSARGISIGEVLDGLYDLRMKGEIYEPLDDHFRVL